MYLVETTTTPLNIQRAYSSPSASPYRHVPSSHSWRFAEFLCVSDYGATLRAPDERLESAWKLGLTSVDLKRAVPLLDRDTTTSIQDMCDTTSFRTARTRHDGVDITEASRYKEKDC
jgi:hypothetical protein